MSFARTLFRCACERAIWAMLGSALPALISCAAAVDIPTASLMLQWDESSEKYVTGYVVYYGGAGLNYTNSVTVSQPSARIDGLEEGSDYIFAVTAWNRWGLQGPLSEPFVHTIPRTRVLLDTVLGVDDTIRIRFQTVPGRPHHLQVSSDLVSWTTLARILPTVESQPIEYSDLIGSQPRFYRVMIAH